MKLMINISDSTYETIMARDWKNAGWLFNKELKAIHDGTPIPDNATNGDVIKAIFSDNVFAEERWQDENGKMCTDVISDNGMTFTDIWWNSTYKRGDTECPEKKQ